MDAKCGLADKVDPALEDGIPEAYALGVGSSCTGKPPWLQDRDETRGRPHSKRRERLAHGKP